MRYIGIDPGLSGAIAFIDENEIVTCVMPTISTGKKRVLDHMTLSRIFSGYDPANWYAIIEEQHAMPKQGVVSMMSIGYGFGALKQCLVDFAIPHEVVRAQIWQKEFSISGRKGNTKTQALQICQSLFPDLNLLATERSKKPHEGIVDSLLICEWGRRHYKGELSK